MHEDQLVMRFDASAPGPKRKHTETPLYARSYIDGAPQRKPLSTRMRPQP